ncbi:MAG TPA: hypothetical protein VE338_05370, partial [Ktedonobacterales bacterium]|nr:hypothetical protein [Ktedonobacterales bacterium]
YECVFGSRFVSGSRVVDYPQHKLLINRLANAFINVLFRLHFNDTTNAFKAYRREVIEGVKPFLSSHFNITVELPLKAITRGYTYTTVPISWYNRATGVSKLRIKEMGSRYLFIVLYVWLEQLLSRGDYRRKSDQFDRRADGDADDAGGVDQSTNALAVETLPRHVALAGSGGSGGVTSSGASPNVSPSVSTPPRAPFPLAPRVPSPVEQAAAASTDREAAGRGLGAWLPVLAGILCVIPVALVGFILLMIWTRTPHVPFWDEWETVTLVQHATQGTLTWNDFWAFHNEHRIVIPQLLDLGLILATHWNRQIEMTFDLLLAVGEWALLLVSVARGLRSRLLSALAILPTGLAVFSLAQYENWVWSYQITFICTVFGVALTLWGLSPRPQPQSAASSTTPSGAPVREQSNATWVRWPGFLVAMVGATIAALSSLGGLVVFVAFLPTVLAQGYKKTLVWLALAAGIIVPYMRGFPHSVPIQLSLTTIKFCITYLGAPAGTPSVLFAFGMGIGSILLAVANVGYYWWRERRLTPLLPWIGLGGYAIGLALITSFGRMYMGPWTATVLTSRYQVYSALWWVAVVYLLLLNGKSAATLLQRGGSGDRLYAAPKQLVRTSSWIVGLNALMLIVATLGMVLTSLRSVPTLEAFQYAQLQTEGCVVNVEYATVPCLWNFYPAPNLLPDRVAYLRAQHDGIFAGNYQRLVQPAPTPSAHALVRYDDAVDGDVWVTSRYDINLYWPYAATGVLGYVYDQQQPGTHALYECITSAGRHFVSLHAGCAGGSTVRTEGWLLNQADASGADIALYECASPSSDVVSAQATCKGMTDAVLLGYALAHEP